VDNNAYGTYELMIAEANGANSIPFGSDFPWASWGPDSKTISTLSRRGIVFVDVATRKAIRSMPRKGVVEQLVWSPDGRVLVGTANGLGQYWNIGVLDASSGQIAAASEIERYNCTPDWMPDSRHVLYSRGTVPGKNERAQLWIAGPGGEDRRMLYAEAGRHIYGGAPSPDGRFLLFSRTVEDLGKVDHARTTMAIIKTADTPMLGDDDSALHKRFPTAGPTRRLDLGPGWEPHWTGAEISWPR
jgi:Tol biopolymer transport system component